ncbi:uncharacterized protein HD556DRAFT_1432578 [Suillus plorans]|uniref:Uncharacterized protein n=1 Tax=Suillus plorans TaxID=116603 RepID=A0A9P7ANZ1_9AGAM|nr:uncharacterized protein HD556DRAFT_1432578 [Suillus plorans]KAG1792398.1 hypothetical protein HD556DRAFT_1432578 [Suillus plorans]
MNGTGGFSPPQQQPQQQPQPYSPPSGGQIAPGSITYTTSTSADGQVTYHPFSYQTPQGVVHGIQWVPAEATQILPTGAQPANAEFAASFNRGQLSREEERELEKWKRSEEKRKKKEEKASLKNIAKQIERDEIDIRMARERDTQVRGRKKSFYGEAPPSGYSIPGTAAYGTYSSADLDRRFDSLDIERKEVSFAARPRKLSQSGAGAYSSPPATYSSPTGYPTTGGAGPYNRAASPYRPVKFPSTYPGGPDPMVRAPSPYGARAPSPYGARAPSPYGARAPSPYGATAPAPTPYGARAPSPYGARAPSPYGGPGPSPYGARAPSPMPPVPRATSPMPPGPPRAPSPYGRPASTYPPPHRAPSPFVPPGQIQSPVGGPRSRAPSPMPGAPAGPGFSSSPRMPNVGFASSPRMPNAGFPSSPRMPNAGFSSSPRMPNAGFPSSPRMPGAATGGDSLQLAAPEAFSRPPNAAQPYTPFSVMRIQEMDKFYDQIPRMPLDWIRFMNDLALAWAGKMPIHEFSKGGVPPKRTSLVADLINLWNDSFFRARRVEVVLYKGRERRSGPHTGTMDKNLPMPDLDFDSDSDSSESSSLSSESEDEYYGRGVDLAESKRRRREKKEEKKWRKKEKKIRKKAKERERQYALYLNYIAPRDMPVPGNSYYG